MLTRSIFKANDIRGIATGPDLEWDADGARLIGAHWADVIGLGAGDRLVLGHDMRTTSPVLAGAFTAGLIARGIDVVDIGLASTDLLWFASGRLGLPGVMFTASHNPGHWNGIKFCLPGAQPVQPEHLAELTRRALGTGAPDPAGTAGRVEHLDLLADYATHLHGLVDLAGLRRLTVVADAGNGMAGLTLPAVLGPLAIDLVGLYTELDGTFPHHQPNPLEPENLVDAQRAVRDHGADLALVFDGDADRCFVIDERGEVVSPSTVTAVIAAQELAREPGATIVRNTITSRAVDEVVAEGGGELVVTRVGHTYVKAAMARHGAIFGGEHSAHYYFRDFWGADTGMLAALHVIALAGRSPRPLSELVAGFARYAGSGEINSVVADVDGCLDRVAGLFAGRGELSRDDGLLVTGPGWWVNLRASNTEPLLRLNVEAPTVEQVERLRDDVLAVVADFTPAAAAADTSGGN